MATFTQDVENLAESTMRIYTWLQMGVFAQLATLFQLFCASASCVNGALGLAFWLGFFCWRQLETGVNSDVSLYSEEPPPIDEETECEEGKDNLVPYGDGICLELVEEPKKDQEDARQ